jgi:hypothetical protein
LRLSTHDTHTASILLNDGRQTHAGIRLTEMAIEVSACATAASDRAATRSLKCRGVSL